MTLEVKQFIQNSKGYQFLFNSLYENPLAKLSFLKESTYEEFIGTPEFKIFFLNNLLLNFLEIALKDDEFISKLDESSITYLTQFISESHVFVLEYEEYKRCFGDNIKIKNLDNGFIDEYSSYSGSFLYLIYIEWKRNRVPKNIFEKAEEFNMELAEQIINKLNELDSNLFFSKQYRSQSKLALERVENYNLLSIREYYLYPKNSDEVLDDLEWFYQFVCSNEFVDVVEKLFEEGKLSGLALGNAIDIIGRGISIKTLAHIMSNFERKLFGEEVIQSFNLERAKEVASKLAAFEIYKQKKEHGKPAYLRLIKSNVANEQES